MTRRDRLIYVLTGTLSLHVAIAIALASVDPPDRRPILPPFVELEPVVPVPPALPVLPPSPEEVLDEPTPEPEPPPDDTRPPPPTDHVQRQRTARTITTTTTADLPASDDDVAAPGGGDAPVYRSENLGAGTMAVGEGKTTPGRHGSGGSGGGSGAGAGSGSGSGTAPEPIVSVASIKTRAKPKGDYAYFDARKDYPEEAKRLGIEGQIKVRLTVSAAGAVTGAKLLTKLGHGLDELAMTRARKLEFEPALDTDDHAVASIVVWTFTFALPD